MRILLVGAGAAYSTLDVENGYLAALRATDAEVWHYDLGSRLKLAREWLHRLWRARGSQPDQRPGWPDAIYRGSIEALEMALRFEVDWVLVISGMFFHPDGLVLIRRAGLRTAVLFTESPYEDDAQARMAAVAEMCWTTERTSVATLALANPRVRYLRHAYDPAVHTPAQPDRSVASHDVVFVGSGFSERIDLLRAVNWEGIDLGLYGEWGLLGPTAKLRRYVRSGPVTNQSAAALYRHASIGLNLHRSSKSYSREAGRVESAESLNPRAYELAASEVFQVSDARAELGETFGPSVPTFRDAQDLEQLLRHALADPHYRQQCATSARARVLPHTFAARAAQLLADLDALDDRPLLRKGA